jgi:hypothetical protein
VTVWVNMESVPIVREEDRFGDNPFYFSPHRRLCLSFSLKACDTSDAVLRLLNISHLERLRRILGDAPVHQIDSDCQVPPGGF